MNRFTWFRKVVQLEALPEDATLRLAASSNAQLWINGHLLRRKVSRYHEQHITSEVINAGPYLKTGPNVVVVLHHNWGPIVTFQRTANTIGLLRLESSWLQTDTSWRWQTAPGYLPHEEQIIGVYGGHTRIRFPQMLDGCALLGNEIHSPEFSDADWTPAVLVPEETFNIEPTDVETPGQREYAVKPVGVIASGLVKREEPFSEAPHSISKSIRLSRVLPEADMTQEALGVLHGQPVRIRGEAGETCYLTVDFGLPVHGYPSLTLDTSADGIAVDFGYCEIPYSLYSGDKHITTDGWLNPEGVVGTGYGDRYLTRTGEQQFELPDERTGRWLTLHIHFPTKGELVLKDFSFIKSQYPIKPVGTFECGVERINQIVKLCLIHAEVTMSDAYVDTPGREDGQWIEDARPRAVLASRWFGDTHLRELMIRTMAQGQYEDGHLHPFAPSNFPAGPATIDWSVQWVGCMYDHYIWTGRTKEIEQYWTELCKYWDCVLSQVNDEGLWQCPHVLADIRVGVTTTHGEQSSGMISPWVMRCLAFSVEMARAVCQTETADRWQAISDKFDDAFRKYHIVPAKDGVPAHVGTIYDPKDTAFERGYSQAAQTKALFTGLMDHDDAVANLNYAFPEPDGTPPEGVTRWNNPTNFYRVLKVLSIYGMTDRAVRHFVERVEPYLPRHPRNPVHPKLQGPYGGPLPEYWISREDLGLAPGEPNTTQPPDDTGSHGWGAVPLLWIHEWLLGVRLLEPGGGRICIAPDDGGLPFISGRTMTPKGLVSVYWDPQRWRLDISLPPGLVAEVSMPKTCEGKKASVHHADGAFAQTAPTQFEVRAAGRYVFEMK